MKLILLATHLKVNHSTAPSLQVPCSSLITVWPLFDGQRWQTAAATHLYFLPGNVVSALLGPSNVYEVSSLWSMQKTRLIAFWFSSCAIQTWRCRREERVECGRRLGLRTKQCKHDGVKHWTTFSLISLPGSPATNCTSNPHLEKPEVS